MNKREHNSTLSAREFREPKGVKVGKDMQHKQDINGNSPVEDLGLKLRAIRTRLGLSVRKAAQLASLSPSMLSKVEGGLAHLSLAALVRLSGVYGVKIGDLVDVGDGPVRVFRARDRAARTTFMGDTRAAWLLSGAASALEVDIMYISPGGESGGPYSHDGEEVAYVVRGEIELAVDGESYLLEAGDLMYFPSTKPHAWSNKFNSTTEILWVTTKGRI